MATTTSNNPPIFTDENKFDGTNWIGWNNAITIAARLRGARGYLEGTIPKPPIAPPTLPTAQAVAVSLPPEPTAWMSKTPSDDEWELRDAWTMGLLIYNIKNPVGLGVKLDGTAAEAWKSLTDQYQVTSELALVNAQRELRTTLLTEGADLLVHISDLRTKWIKANATGAKITDADFRMVLLSSLPPSWDSLVATLYDAKTSADIITRLTMHWSRLTQNRSITNPATTTVTLQANLN